jgi:hypothetical protein
MIDIGDAISRIKKKPQHWEIIGRRENSTKKTFWCYSKAYANRWA